MPATPSTMLPLGTLAPAFTLPDTRTGTMTTFGEPRGARAFLVMFLCNHCPFVKHIQAELARIGRDYQPKSVAIYGISSNDVSTHPDDGPGKMRLEAERAGYTFAYLYDESQQIARAYQAACTPDFFLFDADRKLVYRGQLDDSRPSNGLPVTGRDLRAALDAVLAGKPVSETQLPSIGCNIKWKAGNEPAGIP